MGDTFGAHSPRTVIMDPLSAAIASCLSCRDVRDILYPTRGGSSTIPPPDKFFDRPCLKGRLRETPAQFPDSSAGDGCIHSLCGTPRTHPRTGAPNSRAVRSSSDSDGGRSTGRPQFKYVRSPESRMTSRRLNCYYLVPRRRQLSVRPALRSLLYCEILSPTRSFNPTVHLPLKEQPRSPLRDGASSCRRLRHPGYSFFALGLAASPGALKARPLWISISRLQIGQVLRASMTMSFISEWTVISLRQ